MIKKQTKSENLKKKIKVRRLCFEASGISSVPTGTLPRYEAFMFLKNELKWLSGVKRPTPTTYRPLPVHPWNEAQKMPTGSREP